ncbi:hypothetical protein I4U23_002685 [Adineta vaga]|nr:hypothetical protein I4U23_002685 [Adineta vaga]
MRFNVYIILMITMILLIIMPSTTMGTTNLDVSHTRDKRFLFGWFTRDKSKCRRKGKRCFGVHSVCCSGHCANIPLRSDRCT